MRYVMILLFVALGSTAVNAHPGRTASDGCHFCRTNCSSWGVPQNQRHCHYKAEPQNMEEGLLRVSSPTKNYDERTAASHRGVPSHRPSGQRSDAAEGHGH